MKSRNTVLLLLAATILSSTLLHAEPVDFPARIEAIRNLLKPDAADTPAVKTAKAQARNLPDTLQILINKEQLANIPENGIRSYGMDFSAMPELAEKVDAFIKDLKQELARKEAAIITEAETFLTQTGEQLKNAKKPEDLDPLIQKLNKSKIPEYGSNPKLSAISRDLQNALQITAYWQSYLMAKETGKTSDARSSLQNISSNLTTNPIVPRSYVLRLLDEIAPESSERKPEESRETRDAMEDIITRLTDTGDTAAAMAELKPLVKTIRGGDNNYYFYRAIQSTDDLRKLEPTLSESEVFTYTRNNFSNYTEQRRYSLTRANNQTALNCIARIYGIETPSVKTTTPRKVLETIATSARDKHDWQKLRQAITSLINLNAGNTAEDSRKFANDLTLTSLIQVAENAKQRADFEAAVAAYLEASTLDGMFLHPDRIDPKLAEIRTSHPDVFAKAKAQTDEKQARAEAARITAEPESK